MTIEYQELMDEMKHLEQLRHDYDCACNAYVAELLKMWELDAFYGYWVADEVGGTYCYDATHALSMDEIILCVTRSVSEEEVMRWEDYCVSAAEFSLSTPSLKAWLDGCPRTSDEKFAEFRRMKADLMQAIADEQQRTDGTDTDSADTEQQGTVILGQHGSATDATLPAPTFDHNPY